MLKIQGGNLGCEKRNRQKAGSWEVIGSSDITAAWGAEDDEPGHPVGSNLNHFIDCPNMVAPHCSKKSYILNIPESQTYPGFITHLPHNISVRYSKFCTYQQHHCQQNLRNTHSSGDPFLGVSQVPRASLNL